MGLDRDGVVILVGGLAVALAVAGLAVVEKRTGPFEHGLERSQVPVGYDLVIEEEGGGELAGSGVCQPGLPRCEPTELAVDLRVAGLPRLGAGGVYGVSLVTESGALAAGELALEEEVHTVKRVVETNGAPVEGLLVSLGRAEVVEPSRVVLALPARTVQGGMAQAALPGQATGNVQLSQVGLVEVSITAKGAVEGLTGLEGWSHRALLVGQDGSATDLGLLAPGPDGMASVDARVERLILEEQDRFVVTLVPHGGSWEGRPVGFPVLQATVLAG